jgi:hypothetical protein
MRTAGSQLPAASMKIRISKSQQILGCCSWKFWLLLFMEILAAAVHSNCTL